MQVVWHHGPPLPGGIPLVLSDLLEQARVRAGQSPVLTWQGISLTWDDILQRAEALAAAWERQINPGDRVAIILPNGLPHLLAELAAWRLGAIAAPVYHGLNAALTRLYIARCGARLTVGPASTAGEPVWTPEQILATRHGVPQRALNPRPDDPCLLLSTSGSGGQPRGVLLSHRNLCTQQAAYGMLWPEVGPGDRLASYLPWHHSFGSLAERLWSLTRGAHLTVIPGGGRDHQVFLETLRQVQPTVFMSVPRMHRVAILGGGLAVASLRWAFNAGASLPAPEEQWYARHGVAVHEGWGLTETSPTATLTRPGDPRVPGIVGHPVAGVSVGVRSDGRLLVAGPGVMLGYADDPVADATCLGLDPNAGRWIDTGDLGSWTSHGLRLEGRADLTIKLANGEKVALQSIANHLEARPGVRGAVVVCRDGESLEAILCPLPGYGSEALIEAVAAVSQAEAVPYRRLARAWRLTEEPTTANGLLTPSHKIARSAWLAAVTEGQADILPAIVDSSNART